MPLANESRVSFIMVTAFEWWRSVQLWNQRSNVVSRRLTGVYGGAFDVVAIRFKLNE